MSFSREVKEELSKQIPTARHCMIAEIAGIISICGNISINGSVMKEEDLLVGNQKIENYKEEYTLKVCTENLTVARKYFTLVQKTFNINTEISIKRNVYFKKSKIYTLTIKDPKVSLKVLQATKLIDEFGEIKENLSIVNNMVILQPCCKRAFLRGIFLAAGSISDPAKTYHFEIAVVSMAKARQLQEILKTFDLEAKIVIRKKYYVVYIKEGAQIVDVLNVMEAHIALMKLENVRILKEMRNSINRQVNCETANINKTVVAASKQIEDILLIKSTVGIDSVAEALQEVARLRIEYPEASLKELGSLLNPPIGKSGVNHRLRKLSEIAEQLKEQKEEINHDYETNHN